MKYLAACTLLLFLCGCPDDSIQPSTNPLQLTVEDATCTEVFIKLSLPTNEQNRTVTLKRGDSTIATIVMATNDSLFVDEGLLPKKTYTYTLVKDSRNVSAQATTMDTTSHNWSYTLDTLGESNSYLLDVAIINDTLAYAVGEIHIGDTLYNAAKWNGKKWELYSLKYNGFAPVIKTIFAFGEHDIWLDPWFHWNGHEFIEIPIDPVLIGVGINKMLGNNNGLYVVGTNGFIAYRNTNGVWQKQESGTTHYLVDIDGNGKELYIGGINISRDAGVVLRKNQETWEKVIEGANEGTGFIPQQIFKSQLYGSTNGLWVDKTGTIYTVGNYMYRYKLGQWNYMKSLPENYIGGKLGYRGYLQDVNGNSSNDMFIVGQRGTLRHFNGNTWTQVGIPFNYNDELHFWYRVAVKENLTIVVGSMDRRARAMVLKR